MTNLTSQQSTMASEAPLAQQTTTEICFLGGSFTHRNVAALAVGVGVLDFEISIWHLVLARR
jgi:hypothetical protein